MPDAGFQTLSRRLLDRGIAPKYAARIAAELSDHHADLERELGETIGSEDAAAEAYARLGDESAIAGELLRRPELRAWVYRSVWVLRALSLLLSVAVLALAPQRALAANGRAFVRYLAAGGAATVLTGALLLALHEALVPAAMLERSAARPVLLRMSSGDGLDTVIEAVISRAARGPQPARGPGGAARGVRLRHEAPQPDTRRLEAPRWRPVRPGASQQRPQSR